MRPLLKKSHRSKLFEWSIASTTLRQLALDVSGEQLIEIYAFAETGRHRTAESSTSAHSPIETKTVR
jgi:hypothetical protein